MNDWRITEALTLRQKAPYPGIIFDVVQYDYAPHISVLRFYADNLSMFSDSQLNSIAEWIQKLLDDLNEMELPTQYTYEVVDYYENDSVRE